ncbi:nucleotide sugar dehydrogenase [Azovibrio restrictus]|uniref:nucleotide sugar dehydrogenase n=1 Tax=Azovibrio restrictus TaxID=146938 RepID=UPI0026EDEA5D|nr:nucleotide sugar dehydrogenase [Azovibrio restrictus]MDD3483746.1 nucleotide sugar dehydrogenase [Azovibrio restrictus]
MDWSEQVIAVVGLGYVGLPLAVAFGERIRTVGFDLSETKVNTLLRGEDPTGEVGSTGLQQARQLTISHDPACLASADFIVVAVPTPVDQARRPDFTPLISASALIGRHMKQGATIIYESTVYPGATEEVCIPVLERESGWCWQQDFSVGYSPERINPGDREHTLSSIVKVVAGDTPETLARVADLYRQVVAAGVHLASSIAVAEAAKVIENSQRDINIAFMNELSIIFDKLGLDTLEVLKAAGTKWNFLPFRPGLVGGHCIGVDPYYLTHKAEMLGYHPDVILAGRRINDGMGKFVAEKTVKLMIATGTNIRAAHVQILGITFKENCPDVRNSLVPQIAAELQSYGIAVSLQDPWADPGEVRHEYGLSLTPPEDSRPADALIVAVAHQQYVRLGSAELPALLKPGGVVVDVKGLLDGAAVKAAGYHFWRL